MSQALEKAFHLNVKRFLTKRLQGMVMGAFREVMGAQPVFHTPEEVEIIAGGVTRYMPCGLSDGGMGRTKDGKWISLDDALELAKAERERGHEEGAKQGYAEGKNTSERLAKAMDEIKFQNRVQPWMMECFGPVISADREERNHRFFEESTELVQACGMTASEAHQLVDYVYGRPVGEPVQEVGGVMVTLAALCLANSMDMHHAGEVELGRIWTKVDAIRAKQAAKPKHSPLPQAIEHDRTGAA
jgi:hypothetical protein